MKRKDVGSWNGQVKPLVAVLALMTVSLTGCMSGGVTNPREQLVEAIRDFNEGVHWGRHDIASRFVASGLRATWAVNAERVAREVFYTTYEVQHVAWKRGEEIAKVRVAVGWYHRAAMLEKHTYTMQTWKRVKGKWILTADTVIDGPPVGGVPEAG